MIYECAPGRAVAEAEIRHVNDKAWDVIWFIALHGFSGEPVTSSDVYLGTGLPKRTVIRILERLERLNVICKKPGGNDGRVRLIEFSSVFAAKIDRHLQECITEGVLETRVLSSNGAVCTHQPGCASTIAERALVAASAAS